MLFVVDRVSDSAYDNGDDGGTTEDVGQKNIEGYGEYPVSKGVISLQNDRGTSYRAYIAVQNELVKAINEVRDDFCKQNYGKAYTFLTEDQQKIVREAIPQNISEAEPKDVTKK